MCSQQTWSRSCKHYVANLGTAGIFQRGRGRKRNRVRKVKRDRQTETERNKQREKEKRETETKTEKERVDNNNHGQRRDAQLVQYDKIEQENNI